MIAVYLLTIARCVGLNFTTFAAKYDYDNE